jgi:protein-cysteine N-palmitoyltransferase HHAT
MYLSHSKEELSFFLSSTLSTIPNTSKKKQLDPSSLSERDRVAIPAATSSFVSFRTYLAYILYSPLYLAGPIITFNDYISQSRYPSPSITTRRTVLYGIRFLLTLLCMELLLHYIYVVAISQSSPDWSTYTPFQLSMLAFFNLHIIWLKLLLPWRFFRLWSLIDGIDPPENVVRCMSDNYSTFAFWRGWHRSFNRWIVRYIYIPLGGGAGGGVSKVRSIGNMLAVFTFVALWHDINLRLLMWGWLITLFVLPETLATMAFPAKKWRDRPNAYRVICGVGAVFNILMMMAANLVGFAVGLDGLRGLVQGIISSWQGFAFMFAACSALFVGVQVMFEVRESELRKGIKMKC